MLQGDQRPSGIHKSVPYLKGMTIIVHVLSCGLGEAEATKSMETRSAQRVELNILIPL
jgi:hypothetical protein